jgi:F5/8 type C domain
VTELDQAAGPEAEAPPPAAPSPVVAPAPALGRFRRVLNWFWRGRQLKELSLSTRQRSPQELQLTERAELLFELGNRARNPSERLPSPADAAAAELYRQSAYFAVRALALAAPTEPDASARPWQYLTPELGAKLASVSATSSAELERTVEAGTFVDPWTSPAEQRSIAAARLAAVAQTLLGELSWRVRARDALWVQRLLRIGGLFALVLGTLWAVRFTADRSEQSRDLAHNKPWRASSSMAGFGCNSPLQQCADSPDFFFHTVEEKGPWVEIDLGVPTRIGTVRIDNRKDCCFDRAAPLLVEVAVDPQQFREVSRRTKSFSTWRASFNPTVARYVRVRAPSKTMLHLSQIRVLP